LYDFFWEQKKHLQEIAKIIRWSNGKWILAEKKEYLMGYNGKFM
jgi:hypothetical protein